MLILALPLFVLATLFAAWLEHLLHRDAGERAMRLWSDHFFVPFTRSLCLLLLIAAAYPALFGLHDAPSLARLLHDGERVPHWINALFLCGIVAPMLPGLNLVPGATLPFQACAGVALLFHWLTQALGATASLLPSWKMLVALLVMASIAALAARRVTRALEAEPLQSLVRLWLQFPIVIAYGLHLGQRLQSP